MHNGLYIIALLIADGRHWGICNFFFAGVNARHNSEHFFNNMWLKLADSSKNVC